MAMVWYSTRTRYEEGVGRRTIHTNLYKNDLHGVGVRQDTIDMEGTPHRMVIVTIGDGAEVETTMAMEVAMSTGGVDD